MKRDRLYVGALMMPRRVQQFAHGFRFQKNFSIFLVDRHLAHSQQKALGIFEINKLLQKIEQQHVKLIVHQFDMSCFARFNRIQIVDHHVDRRVGGGCVCCSLLGEFEAAIGEIIEKVEPDRIVVETTGLAEPEALVFNIQEALPQGRLDGVISVIDADMLVRFPELGHTTRLQIEGADILLLNKTDLVDQSRTLSGLETKLHEINPTAAIVRTERCRVDPELLFGMPQLREKKLSPPKHKHHLEFEWFALSSKKTFSRDCFERFADSLPAPVIRAKGFIRFADGAQLFNFVVGRWDLEPFESSETQLVFIGKRIATQRSAILRALNECVAKK